MGYRVFSETITLAGARESAEFTVESLLAHHDEPVQKMARPLDDLLAESDPLAAAQSRARRDAVRANAQVRMADAFADDEVRDLTKDVLGLVRQDRGAPIYRAFFPTRPGDIIELSLVPELGELGRIHGVLEAKTTPPELRKKWAPRIAAAIARGEAAVAGRSAAEAKSAETSAHVEAWMGRVDRARRAVDGGLTTYAAHRGLPHRFRDRFFPPAPQRKKTVVAIAKAA